MKKFNKFLSVFSAFAIIVFSVSFSVNALTEDKENMLQFSNDGKFKILVVCDLHYDCSTEEDTVQSNETLNFLSSALDKEKPNLVIFNGDNVTSGTDDENTEHNDIKAIVSPVKERGIYLAVVFGNHDPECGISKEKQMSFYNEYSKCLMYDDDSTITGTGNYNLLIKNSAGTKNIFNLWFFDSLNLAEDQSVSYYDWVKKDQINWYKNKSTELTQKNSGNTIPSLVFQHIPVCEEKDLLEFPKTFDDLLGAKFIDNNGTKLPMSLKHSCTGSLGEAPCYPSYNGGEFTGFIEMGDVLGAFFGHDHLNTFTGYVSGIMLGQCGKAGYIDGPNHSMRTITLDENNLKSFDTKLVTYNSLNLSDELHNKWFNVFTNEDTIRLSVYSVLTIFSCGILAPKTVGKIISIVKKSLL